MKLKRMTLENFRGYKNPVSVTFDNMTAFIGKNDAGKSKISLNAAKRGAKCPMASSANTEPYFERGNNAGINYRKPR